MRDSIKFFRLSSLEGHVCEEPVTIKYSTLSAIAIYQFWLGFWRSLRELDIQRPLKARGCRYPTPLRSFWYCSLNVSAPIYINSSGQLLMLPHCHLDTGIFNSWPPALLLPSFEKSALINSTVSIDGMWGDVLKCLTGINYLSETLCFFHW